MPASSTLASPAPTVDVGDRRTRVRRSAKTPSRISVHPVQLGAIAIVGGLAMGAAGWGAHALFGASDEAPRPKVRANAAAIRIGPIPEMPEIRNGVPALASAAPSSDLIPRPADLRPLAAALGRSPDSSPPLLQPNEEAANARALASTVAAASFRPALEPRAAVAPPPREPAGPTSTPAVKTGAAIPAAPPTSSIDARKPVASDPNRTAVEVAPVLESEADPAPAPAAVAVRSEPSPMRPAEVRDALAPAPLPAPRVATAPLPPARPAERVADAAPDRAVERGKIAVERGPQTPERVSVRPSVTAATRPGVPSPSAPRTSTPAPAATASLAPPLAAAPRPVASASEDVEVFGVPLPGLAPTGRTIRDAASSIADTVTSLPDRF